MKRLEAIKINGDESEVLSVTLRDILDCIHDGHNYKWSILWLEAISNLMEKPMLLFEEEVKQSPKGYLLDWLSLLKLSDEFYQVIEITIIGNKITENIRRYNNDEDMYLNCCITMELIDSSYWLVHSYDNTSLDCMKNNLSGVVEVSPPAGAGL